MPHDNQISLFSSELYHGYISNEEVSISIKDLFPSLYIAACIARYFFKNKKLQVFTKAKQELYSTADIQVNDWLKYSLNQLFPGIAWFSEEEKIPINKETDAIWIADPIDGTREFVNNSPQYSISISLFIRGCLVLGIIILPEEDLFACGSSLKKHFSTFKSSTCLDKEFSSHWHRLESHGIHSNNKHNAKKRITDFSSLYEFAHGTELDVIEQDIPIYSPCSNLKQAKFLLSKTEKKQSYIDSIIKDFHYEASGSIARKLLLLALGRGDILLSVCPKHLWDIAGGIEILEGSLRDYAYIELSAFEPLELNLDRMKIMGLVILPQNLLEEFSLYWQKSGMCVQDIYVN